MDLQILKIDFFRNGLIYIYIYTPPHTHIHTNKYIQTHTYIRFPMGVEHSAKGIYSCGLHNAKLFERIEHSGIR